MTSDLTLLPMGDGLTYALGSPTTDPSMRATGRFLTQFLSISNADTGRGTVFMQALANGRVRTNSDVVTLVATAGAQIRSLEQVLENDIIFESLNILGIEFIDSKTVNITVSMNTTSGTIVNNILVTG